MTDEIENRNGIGNLVRQTELTHQALFWLKSDHVAGLPTTSDQPRPVYGPKSVHVVVSGPMKTDKSLQKRDERTKVTESRDLFVT